MVEVELAAKYPERVSKFVLYGGYARGWSLRSEAENVLLLAS